MHTAVTDEYVDRLVGYISACVGYVSTTTPRVSTHRNIPGWNDHVQGLYNRSRTALHIWTRAGKSSSRPFNENRKASRFNFKMDLKEIRLPKERILSDRIARLHLQKQAEPFGILHET